MSNHRCPSRPVSGYNLLLAVGWAGLGILRVRQLVHTSCLPFFLPSLLPSPPSYPPLPLTLPSLLPSPPSYPPLPLTLPSLLPSSCPVPRTIVQWPPPEVVDYEGEAIQFDCIASGRPAPTVIWLFQSTPVPLAPDSINSGLQDLGNGSLLIPDLQARHAGTYFCMLQQPPLDIRTFTLTVVRQSSPTPSVILSPAGNSTFTTDFAIGESAS